MGCTKQCRRFRRLCDASWLQVQGRVLCLGFVGFSRGADLSNFASHLDQRLRHPHVSVRCELYDDKLHFELKGAYEKANNTYDGQKAALVRHPLKGTKQTDPPPPHVEESGGNSAGSNDVPSDPVIAEVPVIVAPYPHMREGKAGDKHIYLNDSGTKVMLGVNGRPYPVGVDGVRLLPSTRPEGWDRESWNAVSRPHQKQIIESYRLEAEKAKEVKGGVKIEPVADTVGGDSSGSGGPGGVPPAVALPSSPLPDLLTSKLSRVAQKKFRLSGGGDLACAPMGICG
jgi:hypothetical protein